MPTKPAFKLPKQPDLEWDTSNIDGELEHRIGLLKEEGKKIDEDKIRNEIWNDFDYYEEQWNCLINYLADLLEEINKENYCWRVDVYGQGWLKREGYRYLDCHSTRKPSGKMCMHTEPYCDARKFLRAILPDTDCTFQIFKYKKGIAILNWHHDCPVSPETYYCVPVSDEEYEENNP